MFCRRCGQCMGGACLAVSPLRDTTACPRENDHIHQVSGIPTVSFTTMCVCVSVYPGLPPPQQRRTEYASVLIQTLCPMNQGVPVCVKISRPALPHQLITEYASELIQTLCPVHQNVPVYEPIPARPATPAEYHVTEHTRCVNTVRFFFSCPGTSLRSIPRRLY